MACGAGSAAPCHPRLCLVRSVRGATRPPPRRSTQTGRSYGSTISASCAFLSRSPRGRSWPAMSRTSWAKSCYMTRHRRTRCCRRCGSFSPAVGTSHGPLKRCTYNVAPCITGSIGSEHYSACPWTTSKCSSDSRWPFEDMRCSAARGPGCDPANDDQSALAADECRCPFTNHDCGCVGVPGDQRGHDRCVGDPDVVHAVDPEFVVDNFAHHAAPGRMVEGERLSADVLVDRLIAVGFGREPGARRGVEVAVQQ